MNLLATDLGRRFITCRVMNLGYAVEQLPGLGQVAGNHGPIIVIFCSHFVPPSALLVRNALPLSVKWYFCILLVGFSGIVISINSASRAGWR